MVCWIGYAEIPSKTIASNPISTQIAAPRENPSNAVASSSHLGIRPPTTRPSQATKKPYTMEHGRPTTQQRDYLHLSHKLS